MNKTKINAIAVGDSLSPQRERLTSILATFPRFILAEVNTHRMLSKNTSSSRAIPFNKMVEVVQNDPFIAISWQKHHSGMQGTEYITDQMIIGHKNGVWLKARDEAIHRAEELYGNLTKFRSAEDYEEIEGTGVTKQICNRLLEPFMWTTMLITGSKEGWDNFFSLRCPQYQNTKYLSDKAPFFKSKKEYLEFYEEEGSVDNLTWLKRNKGQAEIHMMMLAECIYDAMNESTPRQLQAGDWHIPFENKISEEDIKKYVKNYKIPIINPYKDGMMLKVQISTAMAARTSYTLVGDEKELDYGKLIDLHDRLINQNPLHASPMEHCARAMSSEEYRTFIKGECSVNPISESVVAPVLAEGWCRNLKGFIQYRHILETRGNL